MKGFLPREITRRRQYSKMQIPMDELIIAGTSSLHVTNKTIMFRLIKCLLPVHMQETFLNRGYKLFYGGACPGVIYTTVHNSPKSISSSRFMSFLYSFTSARMSVRGMNGLLVKKRHAFADNLHVTRHLPAF